MNWAEQVLRLDPYLQPTTRSLVDTISRFFATHASARCQFYDSEAAALLGVTGEQLRQAKYELLRRAIFVNCLLAVTASPLTGYGSALRPRRIMRLPKCRLT